MKKVFLGGTCNGSKWRDVLIKRLKNIEYFNPVVPNWTEEDYQEEIKQREICDYCLYLITPKMKGVYSIAEVVEDSIKRPNKTIFYFIASDGRFTFDEDQIRSLDKVGIMVKNNGGFYPQSLSELLIYLNK